MAREVYLSSDPEQLLQIIDDLESDYSDDDFDGYIDDDDEEIQERMTRIGEIGSGLGTDWGAGDEMEGLSGGIAIGGSSDDGNTSIGMEVELRDQRSEIGSDSESVRDGDGTDGGEGPNDDGNGNDNDSNSSDDDGDDSNSSTIPTFSENVGVVPDMSGKEPVDYYRLFISDHIIDKVLEETNRYGDQYVESHQDHLTNHPRARPHDFVKRHFSKSELLRFFVLIITMGIVDLPSVKDYWSTSWPFNTPHFSKLLSRDRFLLLLKFLHLADNTKQVARGQPGYDKLFKLRPFMDPLIHSFKEMFIPQQQLSIDEAMISYKGRLSFLQYLPKKPKKWGMKAWALADSKLGYIYNWKLYCGKEEEQGREPLGERVVVEMLSGLENKGYHVYFDNFYTSPTLCKRLLTLGFGSCSTVRVDRRGIPVTFKKATPNKGDITTYQDGNILGLKWKDKRYVSVLSTIHDSSMVSKQRRTRQVAGGVEVVQKPAVIEDYNMYMGGVDKSDQLVTYYGFRRCSKKWWKRAFFHLIELAMVNAYILYCCNTPKREQLTHLRFRLAVASSLLCDAQPIPPLQHIPSPAAANVPLRLTGRHFPEPAGGRPDCKVCSDRMTGKRKQTKWQCKTCKVSLCIHPCFERYHTLKHYK